MQILQSSNFVCRDFRAIIYAGPALFASVPVEFSAFAVVSKNISFVKQWRWSLSAAMVFTRMFRDGAGACLRPPTCNSTCGTGVCLRQTGFEGCLIR